MEQGILLKNILEKKKRVLNISELRKLYKTLRSFGTKLFAQGTKYFVKDVKLFAEGTKYFELAEKRERDTN